MTPQTQAALAVETLDENKGIDITDIDVSELTDITEYIVICTATSLRHAHSLADRVIRQLRNSGIRPLSTDGLVENSDWVLIDFDEIVVHIMLAETREFYSLEKLWCMTQEIREKAVGED